MSFTGYHSHTITPPAAPPPSPFSTMSYEQPAQSTLQQPWEPGPYPPLEVIAPIPLSAQTFNLNASQHMSKPTEEQVTEWLAQRGCRIIPITPSSQQPQSQPQTHDDNEVSMGEPGPFDYVHPSAPEPTTPPTGSSKSLMKEPPIFNRDKTAYQEWKCKLTAWIADEKNKVHSDSEQINIALSYMNGEKVHDWIKNYYNANWSHSCLV